MKFKVRTIHQDKLALFVFYQKHGIIMMNYLFPSPGKSTDGLGEMAPVLLGSQFRGMANSYLLVSENLTVC